MHEGTAKARTAGVAYIATIAFGLFAEVYVRSAVRSGDPAVTADQLQTLEPLFRLGILSDALMLVSYVVVTALLYRLFKPVDATLSALAAFFSLIGIGVLAALLTLLLTPLVAGPSLAQAALRLHGAAYSLTGLFFGPYCLLVGVLALRSRWVPQWIGALMMAAGAAFILDASLDIAAPAVARQIPGAVMLVSLIGEGAFALWLALFSGRATMKPAAG